MHKKKIQRIMVCIVVLAMVLSQAVCFASAGNVNTVTEYNPFTMTIEERLAWIEANVEAEYYDQAERIARSETLYTTTKTTTAKSDLYGNIGKLTTRVNFTCNNAFTAVEDWGTSTFTATALISNTIKDTNMTANRISSSRVKLLYESSFTRPEGVYCVEHVYTINGDGSYSVAVHNYVM